MREIPDSRHTNTIELSGRSAQQWDYSLAGRLTPDSHVFPRTLGLLLTKNESGIIGGRKKRAA